MRLWIQIVTPSYDLREGEIIKAITYLLIAREY